MPPNFLRPLLQGRFKDHPIHPLLVHLPIGLWVGSFIFDLIYFSGNGRSLPIVSYYCIAVGFIGALIAAIFGLIEYSNIAQGTEPKRIATQHLVLNLVVVALYVPNIVIRRRYGSTIPGPAFVLSVISVSLLSISGYLGGKLVYTFGIGRHPERRPVMTEKDEDRRIKRVA